jgi:hypothetical protein
MIYSAPSTEHPQSSSARNERSAGAEDAGQPASQAAKKWLARVYDWFIDETIDEIEFFFIAAFAAVPVALSTGVALTTGEPFWILMIPLCGGWCYATAMQGVTMLRDKITERDQRIAEINDSALWRLCERRRELNEALMAENSHLEQDVMHWKFLCLTERGGLEAEDTAAEISCSENKEASAAVVPFKTDGAGA